MRSLFHTSARMMCWQELRHRPCFPKPFRDSLFIFLRLHMHQTDKVICSGIPWSVTFQGCWLTSLSPTYKFALISFPATLPFTLGSSICDPASKLDIIFTTDLKLPYFFRKVLWTIAHISQLSSEHASCPSICLYACVQQYKWDAREVDGRSCVEHKNKFICCSSNYSPMFLKGQQSQITRIVTFWAKTQNSTEIRVYPGIRQTKISLKMITGRF